QLAERHAVLKMVYLSNDEGQRYQQILDRDLVIKSSPCCEDINTLLNAIHVEVTTPFNLAAEPSLRLCHYALADKHYLLL
ncbi:hypothetical protein ID858_18870, partial [Xenorhabdus sp. DI]|uniref:hypothetical protein n=1 Tax=Xenorhabdus doucetiae TaxID=351671 RepID=UPI00199AC33D